MPSVTWQAISKQKKHYSKAETEKLTPIIFVELPNGQSGTRLRKTLLDSGASCSVVNSRAVQNLNCERAKITPFKTIAGQFNCKEICNTQIKMPELKISAIVDVQMHVTQMNGHYNIILGRDIFSKLGIILDFQQQILCWEDEIVHITGRRAYRRNNRRWFYLPSETGYRRQGFHRGYGFWRWRWGLSYQSWGRLLF